ncbi:Glycine rich superfamily member [Caenorhabditis elegans]|uniref:Glycine rich superfamily member n=1 Tax=Caenorhabditis elegans TaxID=6239 RepID=Q86DA6_CAEEL|nr:Glycine rich superfamily member [Caenorhabditis elegans]CAD90171.3 Glycine rich superfamily member [Caenorhabditis elegans]|eukprot:NP_001021177.3 Uncharacterized protein CELE_C18D11.6 [Caenorhabditis elegans]
MHLLSVLLVFLLVFGAFCAPATLKEKVGDHALTWTKVEASQTPHIRTRRWGPWGWHRPFGWGFHRPWGLGWHRPFFGGYGMPFGGFGGYPFWG